MYTKVNLSTDVILKILASGEGTPYKFYGTEIFDIYQDYLGKSFDDSQELFFNILRYGSVTSLKSFIKDFMPEKLNKEPGQLLKKVCKYGNIELAKYLIEYKGVSPRFDNDEPLLHAMSSGCVNIIRYLNEKHSVPIRLSALEIALDNGNSELMSYLIEKGYLNQNLNPIFFRKI